MVIRHLTQKPPHDQRNLVVLATPTSAGLVPTLEDGLPIRSSCDGVYVNAASIPLTDTSDAQRDVVAMQKWGVLTRRPFKGLRALTMLVATHGRTIEAMARFLGDATQLELLANQLGRQEFPECFQALFSVEMTKTADGPIIKMANVEFAYPLDERNLKSGT